MNPTEGQIHQAFIEYVEVRYPEHADCLFHIPNEGKRSPAEGAKQKRLGLRKGVADLFFAWPTNDRHDPLHGLWIEIKTAGGRVSKEQEAFIIRMQRNGYAAHVVRSIDEAIDVFDDYMEMVIYD